MSTLLGSEVSVVVQLFCHVRLFVTPWMAAHQASRSFTISWSLLRLMSIELMMPSSHLNLCHPLLLLPSIVPIIRVFSNDSALCSRWPKYWSFSCSTSPSNEYSELICLGLTGLISLPSKGLSRVFSSTTSQMHRFFCTQPRNNMNPHKPINLRTPSVPLNFPVYPYSPASLPLDTDFFLSFVWLHCLTRD